MPSTPPVLFFDGVCGLCNRFVDLLLREDRGRVLRFAPLQGRTARERLPAALTAQVGTVVLLDGDGVHTRSDAILRALALLGGQPRALAWMGWAVPRPVRDFFYEAIARQRYRWFGRRDACRLPTPQERERFLD
jgi:predicted DCC family thiol-disulfide oxidoreductase YuxK